MFAESILHLDEKHNKIEIELFPTNKRTHIIINKL